MQKITSKCTVTVCAFILNYAWCFSNLCDAKRQCLQQQGVIKPSMDAIEKAITRNELARHCKRKTRGAELTAQLIEELLLDMGTATDSFGVPVFNERMLTIWKEEIKHIPCIQDPPEVALYTVTGHIRKGSMELPVYRCARGTTSLESFHLYLARYGCIKSNRHWLNGVHIVRFIPGTSASNVHFQAYLLEGLSRWNQARALAVATAADQELSYFQP